MKNIIFIAVGAILIIGISVGASVFITGAMSEPPVAAAMEEGEAEVVDSDDIYYCLLYTSPSPRDRQKSRMPSSA